ncbi:RNA-binding cell elongation regulator Jag/EloR [Bacillus massiliglaciei]|uniref:RNA-binding cell elongation regulator Jag/EloR n=1 Tax=Bacillus massiliglaciei TaxID=1816693 RepID=UPI000AA8F882|nr:RNA-binding cell elongation regulator Jag/EloR [Bacillus massiliglaciei]
MKKITAAGRTVEEAVQSALTQLNTTRDRIEVAIIDEGKKGFFGVFGKRNAVIEAVLKPDAVEKTKEFLKNVSEKMGIHADIEVRQEGKNVTFCLSGEKMALLIGKRGQTLNSLQYLAQLVANRYSKHYLNVWVDAGNYRIKRKEALVQLAERTAQKALKTGKAVSLEPMPSYERKIIHTALLRKDKIKTVSQGTEPYRHLVIMPIK